MLLEFNPFEVSLEGRHLVEASAGTGKTYNITSLFIRYLIENDADVDRILVLTYTKAATAELKERILGRLRSSVDVLHTGKAPEKDDFLNQLLDWVSEPEKAIGSLETALRNFDEASIFTIHGFCQRTLQEQSFLSGMLYDAELVPDDSGFVRDAVDDYWRSLVKRAEDSETDRIWLNILREERYLPDVLAGMISTGVGKPYLQLKTDPPAGGEREEDLEELSRLFGEMAAAWEGDRDEIRELLLSEAMNGNRYPEASVPVWMDEMGRWLDRETPSLNLFEKFDRFSAGFIREKGVRKGKVAPDHPFFHAVEAYIGQAGRVRNWLTEFKKELLIRVRRTVRDRKRAEGILGYDDLLVQLDEALNHPQRGRMLADYLRNKYPVALVDEFQDTDPVQYEILSSIYPPGAGNGNNSGLFLIGDPKQSIYSFRGADIFSYLEARSGIVDERKYGLKRNFRSDIDLIESVNRVFERLNPPFMVEEIEFNPAEPGHIKVDPLLVDAEKPPTLRFLQSSYLDPDESVNKGEARDRAAELTAEAVARLLNRGAAGTAVIGEEPVRANDIAVLVRKHSQADLMRDALARRGINSVQYSQKSVFESAEARNLELLLKAVAEPKNEQAIRAALATELFPHTAGELFRMEEDEQRWSDRIGKFADWHRIWQEHGFSPMFRAFMRDSAVERQLISLTTGERKLTNTLQLGELLQAWQKENRGGMFQLVRWLAYKRQEPDEKADEEQLRLESDRELVKIVTMHRSKGLEYPVVFCPFLWDGLRFDDSGDPFIYHDPDHGYRASLELNGKDHPGRVRSRYRAALEEMSESLRLAYVAMTRARQQCTIVYESVRDIEYSALGYLLLGKESIRKQLEAKILPDGSTSPIPPARFYDALEKLIENSRPGLTLEKLKEDTSTVFTGEGESGKPDKSNRTLPEDRKIRTRSIVSSFSSIMHPSAAADEEGVPSDEFFLPEELQPVTETEGRSVFSFPKGPRPGTCLHHIFEDLEFDKPDRQSNIIERNLEQFGFDKRWSEVVDGMVTTVLETDLREGIRLGGLAGDRLVKEMEFYFDLNPFQRAELVGRVREDSGPGREDHFTVPEGFMKGYIDLVFESDGRYYILDYKSNYLGDKPGDYAPARLKQEMELAGYDVQYHIYSVALHRYLKTRVAGYSYGDQFGGVFYLFLRGMGHGAGSNGIYFDRPERSSIERLEVLFGSGRRREEPV